MEIEERPVAVARLRRRATAAAVDEAGRWATMFAGEHGMAPRAREELALAVSDAVTHAVRQAHRPDRTGEVVLTLATDDEWLTVLVEAGAFRHPAADLAPGLRHMDALADRLEFGAGPGGSSTRILMEVPVALRSDARTRTSDPLVGRRPRFSAD